MRSEPILETERLRLRPWRMEDAAAFHQIWGDPDVIWWGANDTFEDSREGLQRLLAKHDTWPDGMAWLAVSPKDGDAIIGDILLQPAPFAPGIEIGWHFRRDAWGKGYATEAATRVLAHAFGELDLERVYAIVAGTNQRSLRIVEKLGMTRLKAMVYANLPHVLFALDAPS